MDYKNQILERIKSNTEVIGIIGLGYVGLPLAVIFGEALAHPWPLKGKAVAQSGAIKVDFYK